MYFLVLTVTLQQRDEDYLTVVGLQCSTLLTTRITCIYFQLIEKQMSKRALVCVWSYVDHPMEHWMQLNTVWSFCMDAISFLFSIWTGPTSNVMWNMCRRRVRQCGIMSTTVLNVFISPTGGCSFSEVLSVCCWVFNAPLSHGTLTLTQVLITLPDQSCSQSSVVVYRTLCAVILVLMIKVTNSLLSICYSASSNSTVRRVGWKFTTELPSVLVMYPTGVNKLCFSADVMFSFWKNPFLIFREIEIRVPRRPQIGLHCWQPSFLDAKKNNLLFHGLYFLNIF